MKTACYCGTVFESLSSFSRCPKCGVVALLPTTPKTSWPKTDGGSR